jgi:HD-GYP domain-containing protein (c-di-GMP phosphodiesterase class II)
VLNKPGPLLPEERAHVEQHVRIGYDMLHEIPSLEAVAEAVLYHHERFDGSGYPHGLAGTQIPVASRIVAVVDAYCAMIDERSYKEAYTPTRARAELLRCAGTQFDPVIVRAVLAAIREIDNPTSPDATPHRAADQGRLQQILTEQMPHSLHAP